MKGEKNMKKSKALTAALVAGLISAGTGYAWWTDALNINSTVQTGNLSVKFVSAEVNHDTTDNNKYLQNGVVTVADKNVTFAVGNMYPGAVEKFNAKFVNDGTIPAVVSDVVFTSNFAKVGNTVDKVNLKGDVKVYDKDNNNTATYQFDANAANFDGTLEGIIKNKLRVEPSGYVQIEGMKISLDASALDKYETDTLTMNLGLSFKQHNQ